MCHAQSSSILEAHAGSHCCHVSASVLSRVLKPEYSRPQREHDGAELHQLNSVTARTTSSQADADHSQLL